MVKNDSSSVALTLVGSLFARGRFPKGLCALASQAINRSPPLSSTARVLSPQPLTPFSLISSLATRLSCHLANSHRLMGSRWKRALTIIWSLSHIPSFYTLTNFFRPCLGFHRRSHTPTLSHRHTPSSPPLSVSLPCFPRHFRVVVPSLTVRAFPSMFVVDVVNSRFNIFIPTPHPHRASSTITRAQLPRPPHSRLLRGSRIVLWHPQSPRRLPRYCRGESVSA